MRPVNLLIEAVAVVVVSAAAAAVLVAVVETGVGDGPRNSSVFFHDSPPPPEHTHDLSPQLNPFPLLPPSPCGVYSLTVPWRVQLLGKLLEINRFIHFGGNALRISK